MNKCEICGRETNRIYRLYGYTLCSKHMHQLYNHGKFLDNIPRTNSDLNDYVANGDVVVFNLYGQDNQKNGEFTIDSEDLKKIKYRKWRFSHGHIVTGLPAKGTQRDLSHVILDLPRDYFEKNPYMVVDHINCDPTDNRKSNLRLVTQGNNTCNKSTMITNTSGFIGVWFDKGRNTWNPEIRCEGIRCHLPRQKSLKEAVYSRYIAEEAVFKDFCNEAEHKKKEKYINDLPTETKREIEKITLKKLEDKGMLNRSGD